MARRPTTGLLSQYAKNAGGASASGYWLKFFAASYGATTSPLTMYTQQTGGVGLSKCKLNTRGEPISNSGDDDSTFIPYIDGNWDAYIFFTESDADANNTVNSFFLGTNIEPEPDFSTRTVAQFATVEGMIDGEAVDGSSVDYAVLTNNGAWKPKVSTVANNSTSGKGGADYTIWTLADYRTFIGNGGWVPDGYGDHYVGGGTTYVAILNIFGGTVYSSQLGGGQEALDFLESNNDVDTLVIDQNMTMTANKTVTKTLKYGGGVINGAFVLTISGTIDCPRKQFFGSSLTATTASGYELSYCYPEWFKLSTDTDDTSAFQKALNFLIEVGGHVDCRPNFTYTYSDGIICVLTNYSVTIGGPSQREQAKFTQTGNGVGIWFRSGVDLFVNGRVVNVEITGPDSTAGNETSIGFRFSDGWGHGCIGVTQRGFDTGTFVQFYNYDRWTENWVMRDIVVRRPRITIDFERDTGVTRTNTDSFGWGIMENCNISVGSGALGYGAAIALNISSVNKGGLSSGEVGANVYGINIESLVLFSEVSGNVRFFNVRNDGNILTGQADISIDGFINQNALDHQILYQRDNGYINLQGRFIHQQGSAARPADQWRALCFTEPVNSLPSRRSPCNYIGAVVRIGDTTEIGNDDSFTYQLNAGCVYRIKLSAKGDNSYINAEYIVTTYSGDLISDVVLNSGLDTTNIKVGRYSGLANHAFSVGNGGKISVTLNAVAAPEAIVWYLDIEQIAG